MFLKSVITRDFEPFVHGESIKVLLKWWQHLNLGDYEEGDVFLRIPVLP